MWREKKIHSTHVGGESHKSLAGIVDRSTRERSYHDPTPFSSVASHFYAIELRLL
jgi:hypothetical protein